MKVSKRFGQMGSHLTTAKFTLSRLFLMCSMDVLARLIVPEKQLQYQNVLASVNLRRTILLLLFNRSQRTCLARVFPSQRDAKEYS